MVFDEATLAKNPPEIFSVRLSTGGHAIKNLLVKIIIITYTAVVLATTDLVKIL